MEGRPPSPVTSCTIDEAVPIIDPSDAWLESARENDSPELTLEAVRGRSLWFFVEGDETRRLHQILPATARGRDTPILLPFRRGSPTMRRDMRLIITPMRSGSVRPDGILVPDGRRPVSP